MAWDYNKVLRKLYKRDKFYYNRNLVKMHEPNFKKLLKEGYKDTNEYERHVNHIFAKYVFGVFLIFFAVFLMLLFY